MSYNSDCRCQVLQVHWWSQRNIWSYKICWDRGKLLLSCQLWHKQQREGRSCRFWSSTISITGIGDGETQIAYWYLGRTRGRESRGLVAIIAYSVCGPPVVIVLSAKWRIVDNMRNQSADYRDRAGLDFLPDGKYFHIPRSDGPL